jgi:type IV pilus assembly protein PilY1
VNRIINWIRGQDQGVVPAASTAGGVDLPAMRGRKMFVDMVPDASNTPDTTIYWKLGDVIHSTPITVARPAENYDLLYRDTTYAEFSKRWLNRRHVIYFGGNDGMLHAINGGFYTEAESKFCRKLDTSGKSCAASEINTPVLGEELWAYVPYNILPSLSCLTDTNYEHKYFVDLRPRIFDVRIFDEEAACSDPTLGYEHPNCIHPNGWGTILVGGMRFGGTPVVPMDEVSEGTDWNGDSVLSEDSRIFASSYFILDITDPEKLPVLLGETTTTANSEDLDDDGVLDAGEDADSNGVLDGEISLGYTTIIPTMVPMNDGTNPTEWTLILGSGPTELDGTSDQNARLGVIPLHDRMNPSSLKSLRIPARQPDASGADQDIGTIFVPDANSFVSDLITVDLETRPEYKADVVYFGTITGDWTDGVGTEGWGGKLYRLVTRSPGIIASGTSQVVSRPNEWPTLLDGYSLTNPNVLYDPEQPIVTAPTVGTDGLDFWVYFGTGRFFDADDKTDDGSNALQTFYGIREPIECGGASFGGLNWKTVTNVLPTGPPDPADVRGDIGLLPVQDIAIQQLANAIGSTPGVVGCDNSGAFDADTNLCIAGLPIGHDLLTNRSFDDLQQYLTGLNVYCWPGTSPGFDGWSKDLLHARERNLGQATLLGGLLTFSSYIPNTDICNPEGSGYLYGVYYQTGTSWYEDVFGREPATYGDPIDTSVFLGAGLSTTPNIHVGEKEGGKAFIQTSVGQIVEIPQPNLPAKNVKSGRIKWRDIE